LLKQKIHSYEIQLGKVNRSEQNLISNLSPSSSFLEDFQMQFVFFILFDFISNFIYINFLFFSFFFQKEMEVKKKFLRVKEKEEETVPQTSIKPLSQMNLFKMRQPIIQLYSKTINYLKRNY